MKKYQTTKRADNDIREIYKYTVRQFGYSQAELYIEGLYRLFEKFGESPSLGKRLDMLKDDYFRIEYESHTAFYRKQSGFIRIVRVLHGKMDYKSHI